MLIQEEAKKSELSIMRKGLLDLLNSSIHHYHPGLYITNKNKQGCYIFFLRTPFSRPITTEKEVMMGNPARYGATRDTSAGGPESSEGQWDTHKHQAIKKKEQIGIETVANKDNKLIQQHKILTTGISL